MISAYNSMNKAYTILDGFQCTVRLSENQKNFLKPNFTWYDFHALGINLTLDPFTHLSRMSNMSKMSKQQQLLALYASVFRRNGSGV